MSKKLIKGDRAPKFQTKDIWDRSVNVPSTDLWTYVSFHRFADCPFCTLRTNELIKNYSRFQEHDIGIVSIWPSAKEKLLQHGGDTLSPFPIVSDPEKEIYRAYGVTDSSLIGAMRLLMHPGVMARALKAKKKAMEVDADPKLMPASFLLSPEGEVRMAYYGKHFGDHPAIDAIVRAKNAENPIEP